MSPLSQNATSRVVPTAGKEILCHDLGIRITNEATCRLLGKRGRVRALQNLAAEFRTRRPSLLAGELLTGAKGIFTVHPTSLAPAGGEGGAVD
jgi:hypothetical protein